MQDILVDNSEFDEAYIIQSNDEPALKALLDTETQNAILAMGRDLSVSIYGGLLELELCQEFDTPHDGREIARLVDGFAKLRNHLINGENKLILSQVDFSTVRNSTCMVCGDSIENEKPVYCRSCQTPHHHDCWQYLGKCSMYACGEHWCDV
jgi:hypothetical protein